MREKVRRGLQVAAGSCFGVYIGTSLSRWDDYRKYPELYLAGSAPWYTSIGVGGIITAALCSALAIAWFLLGRKAKK